MLAYIHQTCGKPAFMLREWPLPLSRISSQIALHLNGQRVEEGSACICESCGVTLNAMVLHTRNIRTMI